MAISKILHMKDTGSYHGRHLKAAIDYILKEEKTQECRLAGAVNCQLSCAFEQMRETKERFQKTDKRQGYHIILSFKEGEVDADTAFLFVQRFVAEYLGGSYEAVYSVHDNTDHVHAHIVFNSVSFVDGHKYRYKKGDWARYIQPITNRLCEEYGLSTIEIEENGRNEKYKEQNDYRDGKFVWGDMVRRDLDACILQAATYEGFLDLLCEKGYEIKNGNGEGKYLSVKPQGMSRFKRCRTLGEDYSEERIRQRIVEEQLSPALMRPQERAGIVYCMVKRYRRANLSGLQKRYYRKLYATGQLKKKPYSQAWRYKDDVKNMQKLQAQYLFLVNHDIHSMEQLAAAMEALEEKKKESSKERSRIYRARSKSEGLFSIADKMEELQECEECYRRGDHYFIQEHEEWLRLEADLKAQGYSYEETLRLKEHYRSEYAKISAQSRVAGKELKLAESIRRDYFEEKEREVEQKKELQFEMDKKQPVL